MSTNTAILTEDDAAINSKDFWGYAIERCLYSDPNEMVGSDKQIIPHWLLIACSSNKSGNVVIFNFGSERALALKALESLLQAIDDGDRLWDVDDHKTYKPR